MHNRQTDQHVVTFETELGWMGAIITRHGIAELVFGYELEREALDRLDCESAGDPHSRPTWWRNAQNLLVAYAGGHEVDLSQIPLDLPEMTRFQRQVQKSLQNVSYGETVTYAELAQRAGSPGAARAVGNQMAKNRIPIIIPCHRVVGSGGRLGGFSAPQGLSMKRRLLAMEGALAHDSVVPDEPVLIA